MIGSQAEMESHTALITSLVGMTSCQTETVHCVNALPAVRFLLDWNKISTRGFFILPNSSDDALQRRGAFMCQGESGSSFQRYVLHSPIILDQSLTTWRGKWGWKHWDVTQVELCLVHRHHIQRECSAPTSVWTPSPGDSPSNKDNIFMCSLMCWLQHYPHSAHRHESAVCVWAH